MPTYKMAGWHSPSFVLQLAIVFAIWMCTASKPSKQSCSYTFTVQHSDVAAMCGKDNTKNENLVDYLLQGSGQGQGHRHRKHHQQQQLRMMGDEGVSEREIVGKLLLTVNKLLQHQNVLENVKTAHLGIKDLKNEMHDQKDDYDILVERITALENHLQLLTSGKILLDQQEAKTGLFRHFTGRSSRFLDCPVNNGRRIHEMAPIKTKYNELIRVVPRSCSEWRKGGFTQKGMYLIDPDGMEDTAPFSVECDMKQDEAAAIIHHDQEKRSQVKGHEDSGSYNVPVTYKGVSREQLASLTSNSYRCTQFLKWECKGAAISRETWWVNAHGEAMPYWAGGKVRGCACLQNNTCQGGNLCNCDANSDTKWTSDAGFISEKEDLPVSRLQFGDTGSSLEEGYFTLGPLYCFSNKTNPYETSNAFMPVEIYPPFNVFCDLEGWIVIARRNAGSSLTFDRDWSEYRNGFGKLEDEFWLGLEKLHHLTGQDKSYTLQMSFASGKGIRYYAQYTHFHVSSETDGYRLYIGHYTGTIIDALSAAYGQLFSTRDKDQDQWNDGSCAKHAQVPPPGGWWYTDCGKVFLFGEKIIWGAIDDMKYVEMKIKPMA